MNPILFSGIDFHTITNIFFRGCIILQLIRHTINWQVGIELLIVYMFECIEYFLSEFTFKLIVIFTFDMYNELLVVLIGGTSDRLDRTNINPSLHTIPLDVVQILVGKQKCPILLHSPSV